jgi:hypothetical protein
VAQFRPPFDFIIGTDIVYEPVAHKPLTQALLALATPSTVYLYPFPPMTQHSCKECVYEIANLDCQSISYTIRLDILASVTTSVYR